MTFSETLIELGKGKMIRMCSVHMCGNRLRAKGYCVMHLKRYNKYGSTEIPEKVFKKDLNCTVQGCNEKIIAKDMCNLHYRRWMKNGNTDKNVRVRADCKVEGCGRKSKAQKLCSMHYKRLLDNGTTDKLPRKPVWNKGTRGICKVDNCNVPSARQGYCNRHALRMDKYGTTDLPKREPKKCSVEGCENKYCANGYCRLHDRRVKRNGTPILQEKEQRFCSIEGCGKKHNGNGYCTMHRARWKRWGDPMKVGTTKGCKFKPEQIEKMRQAKLGKDQKWYESQGKNHPLYGIPRTEEDKKKMSDAQKIITKTPEWIENMSKAQKKRFENKENHPRYGVIISEEQKEKTKQSWTPEMRDQMAIKASKQNIKKKNTDIELLIQSLLEKENIPYITQKPFKVGNRLHCVDIFVSPNICIEADGERWHNYPYGTKRDHLVNETLRNQRMIVLRFWRKETMKNPSQCIATIKNALRSARGDNSL